MKSITTKIIVAALTCMMSAVSTMNAQDESTAVGYMDVISKEFKNIQQNTWEYTSSVAHGKSARKVEKRRKEVITANREAISKVKRMKPFNGSTAFRDSALSFLNTNFAVLNEDYAKLMDMEEVAEQSYDLMEAYMTAREKANEKLHASGDMIEAEYSTFAKANNINLIESKDKLSKNVEIANQVYKHYNQVYLVFFKSYKQEAYMLVAMEKSDVNGIEQNKNALTKTAEEGLKKLETVELYKNDPSIVKACKQLLDFYKEETEKKMADVSNFYVSKENFEKIKTAFDAKPQKERKKEDVDSYNKAVNDYNAASNKYNAVNAELNAKRNQLIDNYNKACASFTDKHVPTK